MCGIFGVWRFDGKPVDLAALGRALDRLRHRGPDDEGYLLVNIKEGRVVPCGGQDTDPALSLPRLESFAGQSFDLAFGFRRLSIIDLSPAGHQPMSDADGRLWIVYNGEIYNHIELRAELRQLGYRFQSGADTEVILAAYQQWGQDCLSRLNGMWAFAIWDAQEKSLFLSRDRFGVKPLHMVQQQSKFAFASEIKALVGSDFSGAHGVAFAPDENAVHRYLAGGVLPSPQEGATFFRGVQALPPAHWLRIAPGRSTRECFWSLPEPDSIARPANEVTRDYRDLLQSSIRLRLRSDVPVGTCLSGGVDSSSIVCLINRMMTAEGLSSAQIGQQQRTFSAVYESEGPYNERAYVEKVIAATGAEQNLIFPTAERLRADMERLVWQQDEPFLSTSILAQWCVMQRVHERGVTVLLDGQGADEVLAGYWLFDRFLADLLRRGQLGRAIAEAREIEKSTGPRALPLLAKALAYQLPGSWLEALRRRRGDFQMALSTLNRDFRQSRATVGWQPLQQRTFADLLQNLVQESSLPHLLRYEDRNSMAFSVEARVPFLDYRLVEYSFRQAFHWCVHQGWAKWVLRAAMRGLVPDEILWRKAKVGFWTPEAEWIQQWLANDPDLFASQSPSGRYLDLAVVRESLRAWSAEGKTTKPVWRWINLEMWLRAWARA